MTKSEYTNYLKEKSSKELEAKKHNYYNKINNIIDSLLQVLDDEKPTIVRLCLSSLNNLLLYKIDLSEKVESKLKNMDLSKYKDSMKPLIQKDIDCILNQL